MHVLLELRQFWNTLEAEFNNKRPNTAGISAMHIKLQELQEKDSGSQKIRVT